MINYNVLHAKFDKMLNLGDLERLSNVKCREVN